MPDFNTKPDPNAGIVILSAETSAPFPPTDSGSVTVWTTGIRAVGIFDLELFAASPVDLTDAKLYGLVGAVWYDYGFLGAAADGAMSLDDDLGYTTRINHRSRTEQYAIVATFSSAVAVTATVHIVQGI